MGVRDCATPSSAFVLLCILIAAGACGNPAEDTDRGAEWVG